MIVPVIISQFTYQAFAGLPSLLSIARTLLRFVQCNRWLAWGLLTPRKDEIKKATCFHPAFSGSDWRHKSHNPWSDSRMNPHLLRLPVNTGAISGTHAKSPLFQTATFSVYRSLLNLKAGSALPIKIQPLRTQLLMLHMVKRLLHS